jgi:putative membrane protein
MKIDRFLKQFNWRFLLVRILVNALALAVTAAITPKISFVDRSVGNWLLMALMLGVLNALLKPILQFLTLQFIFVTYGLVVVVVNALLLWLLSLIFPARFAVENFWWLCVGGLVLGLLSSFLESLLGLTMPILPDEPPELRRHVEEQARQVTWLAPAGSDGGTEDDVSLAAEAAEALVAKPPAAEDIGAETPVVAVDADRPASTKAETKPLDPMTTSPGEESSLPESGDVVDPEARPQAGSEQEGDRR